MASRKSDLRLGILSPRQTPVLLTSVSQVTTPTRLAAVYTQSNHTGNRQPSSSEYKTQGPAENEQKVKSFNTGQSAGRDSFHFSESLYLKNGSHLSKSENKATNIRGKDRSTSFAEQHTTDDDTIEDVHINSEKQVIENEHIKPEKQVMSEDRYIRENAGLYKIQAKLYPKQPLDSEIFDQHIESQIIPVDPGKLKYTDMTGDNEFNDLFRIVTNEGWRTEVKPEVRILQELGHDTLGTNTGNIDGGGEVLVTQHGRRSHSSSIGSNSVGSEYGSLSTRCSVCDGCGTSLLTNQPISSNNPLVSYRPNSDSRLGNSLNRNGSCDSRDYNLKDDGSQGLSDLGAYGNPAHVVNTRALSLSESGYNTEGGMEVPCELSPDCSGHLNPSQTPSVLSNIIVFTTWIQFSRYKDLQMENLKQKKVMSDYERRLESMIVMVLLISKQMKKSMSKLESLQMHLNQLQDRQVYYEKRLRRLYLGIVCLLLLYVLQVTSFKKQLSSMVRFFGICEVFDRINRTRKVVAKNWRNIPSLLTDFWRIFIFRSRSNLQKRFS